ncbi:MAG: assimilatory sulfite reductase (NADPH) hemoprotein subunit, partial [Gammaproteobacteria bacterium]
LSEVERIKTGSGFLRGTIVEGLEDAATGALAESDTQLTKFHGIYQQDDRDLRNERQQQRLEPAYSFMIRARVPGGRCTPEQWLAMDRLAREHANGSLRLTTRQAFQLHGVIKRRLKPTIAAINHALLDTLAACGDVNRNVMCSPNPDLSTLHEETLSWAQRISDHLTPRTTAYHDIWLDGERMPLPGASQDDTEPVYGATYLPRKFKIGIATPPANDVDVFSQDLGLIAITDQGRLIGFNVLVGGGMGVSHGEPATYPRIADEIGFCTPDQVLDVAEKVVTVQRDFGNRSDRKQARLKYTIDAHGLEWFRGELGSRLNQPLQSARPYRFLTSGDALGWSQGQDQRWHLALQVPAGRVVDSQDLLLMSGLRAIASALAELQQGTFLLTPNQNLIISGITENNRTRIAQLASDYGLLPDQAASAMRRGALACVAFPTCGLAMAESERYLPQLLARIEPMLSRHGLTESPITLRITGCPNGCARPYLAEIGLVGKAPGRYNLYLGASNIGDRLSQPYLQNADESTILEALDDLFGNYSRQRHPGEHFGDFLLRAGIAGAVRSSYHDFPENRL